MSDSPTTLLRLRDVQARTGIARTQLYSLAKLGNFPRPAKISERCSAWPASEVDEWIAARIAARDANNRRAA
jgi:prophage regulatory protein